MISRTYFTETYYDMSVDIATRFAQAIREAWLKGTDFDGEKQKGFFLSKNRGFEDKLYVGNIHRIENHLYWNDEELADDDEIVNVVVIDGPVTRDGDGCSYGSKDHRDQILYANTIPQVKGHIFIINTPGGAASARIDYEQAIADCREKGKATVAWVDGMCCSAGQLVASLCDRTIVMNGRDTMGCIGTMCAFWGVPHNTVDQDGYRYIELVSVTSPDKNAEYREAVDGNTEKLQAELDRLGEEFRETVRQNRPLVKEEHLTGKTFEAQEVMGELVDEVGDYTRAIEAVFELANGTMPAARNDVQNNPEPAEKSEEQEDLATLNEQQKGAIAANPGMTVIVDDGHVSTSVQTMFGPVEQEIAKPQNNNDMPNEEEKKAAEVEATAAAEQEQTKEVPATETPEEKEEVAVTQQQTEQEAEEDAPATEEPQKEAEEDAPATEGPEQEAEEEAPATEGPEKETEEEAPATEGPEQEAEDEIDKIQETLRNAEALVEQKDKEISELKETLSTLEGAIEERDNAKVLVDERDKTIETLNGDMEVLKKESEKKDSIIEQLQKQVSDLKAEVNELAGKPTPMTTGDSGVPADNGTGEAPKSNKHQRIKSGMTYKEIRASQKED